MHLVCNELIPDLKSYYARVIFDLNIRDNEIFFLYETI